MGNFTGEENFPIDEDSNNGLTQHFEDNKNNNTTRLTSYQTTNSKASFYQNIPNPIKPSLGYKESSVDLEDHPAISITDIQNNWIELEKSIRQKNSRKNNQNNQNLESSVKTENTTLGNSETLRSTTLRSKKSQLSTSTSRSGRPISEISKVFNTGIT